MSVWEYLGTGFVIWILFRGITRMGGLLELIALMIFWPLVAAAAFLVELACCAAWIREQIVKRWRK